MRRPPISQTENGDPRRYSRKLPGGIGVKGELVAVLLRAEVPVALEVDNFTAVAELSVEIELPLDEELSELRMVVP